MRSRLEAAVAETLDALNCYWEYEPQAFASNAGQYLPDFRIKAETCRGLETVYIEARPTEKKVRDVAQRETSIVWASHPGPLFYVGWIEGWKARDSLCGYAYFPDKSHEPEPAVLAYDVRDWLRLFSGDEFTVWVAGFRAGETRGRNGRRIA